MKKFALHYNRCTVVTRYFNVNFVPFKKEVTLGTMLIRKKKNLSAPANGPSVKYVHNKNPKFWPPPPPCTHQYALKYPLPPVYVRTFNTEYHPVFESFLGFLNNAIIGPKIRCKNQKHTKGVQWISPVVYYSLTILLIFLFYQENLQKMENI